MSRSNPSPGLPAQNTRLAALVLLSGLVAGCSDAQIEEFVFRKAMEYELKSDCGDDDACAEAIELQIRDCLAQSDWRRYLDNEDDPDELQRFIHDFFPCFKDADGNAYFPLDGSRAS